MRLLELSKRIHRHWSELDRYSGSKIFPTFQSGTEIATSAISAKSDRQGSEMARRERRYDTMRYDSLFNVRFTFS